MDEIKAAWAVEDAKKAAPCWRNRRQGVAIKPQDCCRD